MITKYLGGVERIDLYFPSAIFTIGPQMLEALQISALALPIADLIFDKLKRGRLAKIGYTDLKTDCRPTGWRSSGIRSI
jgi:hypothetical protein